MTTYIVAVSDLNSRTNEVGLVITENEMEAVVAGVIKQNNKIEKIKNILLKKYKDVDSLKNYFSDYWNLGVSTPLIYRTV